MLIAARRAGQEVRRRGSACSGRARPARPPLEQRQHALAPPRGMSPASTGTWWKVIPNELTSSSRSGWFEATSTTSASQRSRAASARAGRARSAPSARRGSPSASDRPDATNATPSRTGPRRPGERRLELVALQVHVGGRELHAHEEPCRPRGRSSAAPTRRCWLRARRASSRRRPPSRAGRGRRSAGGPFCIQNGRPGANPIWRFSPGVVIQGVKLYTVCAWSAAVQAIRGGRDDRRGWPSP